MITITNFQPKDQLPVKNLILNGLVEHWGFLDPTMNPDLEDIATSYALATFLVARDGEKIVGTGALLPRSRKNAEIVRMSVDHSCRRQGIGRMILQQLVETARRQGFCQVTLETTDTWQEVIAFYLDFGFQISHHQDEDVYFVMNLTS